MVKGISRRVIIIKSPDPEIFDEAIFLVKEEAFSKGKTKSDVLRQAQSVANEYIRDSVTKKKKKTIPPYIFALLGAAATAAAWIITIVI